MLTYGHLRRQPVRFAELRDRDVLIAASTPQEVLIEGPKAENPNPSATMVFMHETIALMKAERAARLEQLQKVINDSSALIPIAKKPTSFWENVTMGRAATSDIVLDDRAVSNVHAELMLGEEAAAVCVQDVGSSNGTYVNREPLQPHQPHPLTTGDCLRLGQTVFYYLSNSALAELLGNPP